MPISITYPKTVELADGNVVELTEDTWKQRQLIIVTDQHENEIRQIFHAEEFVDSTFAKEIVKNNQLGSGLKKKVGIWQIHVRFFPHGNKIAIDAEAELSDDYGIEHLTHGWISAFKETWNIIQRRVGKTWVFHKGYGKYVVRIITEGTLQLKDPKTKTDPKIFVLVVVAIIVSVVLIASALKKK